MGRVRVRPMHLGDIDAVVAIETEAFTSPWRKETFASLVDRPTVEVLVMEDADVLVGYAVLWCVLDQGELANLAVTPERRGQGLGAHLLRHVLDVARSRAIATVYLEVRASNDAARALYRSFGFSEVGVRRGYYESPKEDARVMAAKL